MAIAINNNNHSHHHRLAAIYFDVSSIYLIDSYDDAVHKRQNDSNRAKYANQLWNICRYVFLEIWYFPCEIVNERKMSRKIFAINLWYENMKRIDTLWPILGNFTTIKHQHAHIRIHITQTLTQYIIDIHNKRTWVDGMWHHQIDKYS